MPDVSLLSIATASPAAADKVLGVKGGVAKQLDAGPSFGQLEAAGGSALVGHAADEASAVTRTVRAKLRDTVSVKDFGAIGDGVTDDTTALNLAFAQVGAKVYVPRGSYKVTANLKSPACFAIIGDGLEHTTFLPTAAVTLFMFLGTLSARMLEGFQVDGSETSGAVGFKVGNATLPVGKAGGPWSGVFRDVQICNFKGAGGIGMWYADALKSRFSHVKFTGSHLNVLTETIYGAFPTFTTFHRCEFTTAETKGLVMHQGASIILDGCLFESNAHEGLDVDPDVSGGDVIDLVLQGGCWFEDNYGSSIGNYQMRVAATARTARVSVHGGYFSGGAATARAIIFTGSGVRAQAFSPVVPLTVAGGIKIGAGVTIDFPSWSPNINFATVVDYSAASVSSWRYGNLQFPATQVTSTDPNTLDDYDEGTFTPALMLGSGSVTYTMQTGRYTKIGRLVTVEINLTLATVTTPSGTLQIRGLPFVAAKSQAGAVSVFGTGLQSTATSSMVGQVESGASTLRLFRFAAGNVVNPAADLKAGSAVYLTASYSV